MSKAKRKTEAGTFEQLRAWAMDYWGLMLYRADPSSHGRLPGDWRTGVILCGNFPGHDCIHRRFSTLRQLARALKFHKRLKAARTKGRKG